MRRRALACSLLALALLVTACTSSPSGSPTTPSTQPSSPVFSHDGTAVVAVSSLPTNFNPSAPAGGNRITQEVMEQVWPQTFVTNDKDDQTLEPGFVESAEVVGLSPLRVEYTLNPAAKWSDGVPITAADFIYNWREQLVYGPLLPDAGLVAGYRDISRIASSKNGHTVTVTFDHPFAEWESLFADLVPAHIAERYGWVSAFKGFDRAKVISGGPFLITTVIPGKELVLSRNPSYWAPKPSLSHIVLKVMSTASALTGLESGTVSVAETPEGPQVTNVLAEAARSGRALSHEDSALPTLWQLCLNETSPALRTGTFRLGIEDALYLAEISADSAGLEDDTLAPDFERFLLAGEAASSQQDPEPWDPATSLGYLTSLGLVKGTDGYLRNDDVGTPVTLSLLIPSEDVMITEAADVIQAELQAIGIGVVIHEEPLAVMLGSTMPEGNYELAIAPFLLTPFADGEAAVYSLPVLPGSVGGGGSLPWSTPTPVGTEPDAAVAGVVTRDVFGLNDPVLSHDVAESLTNLNSDQAGSELAAADTRMWQDVPTIPLFQQPVAVTHESQLMNVSESSTWAGVFWSAEDWALQLRPAIPPPTFPGVTPPSTAGG